MRQPFASYQDPLPVPDFLSLALSISSVSILVILSSIFWSRGWYTDSARWRDSFEITVKWLSVSPTLRGEDADLGSHVPASAQRDGKTNKHCSRKLL